MNLIVSENEPRKNRYKGNAAHFILNGVTYYIINYK